MYKMYPREILALPLDGQIRVVPKVTKRHPPPKKKNNNNNNKWEEIIENIGSLYFKRGLLP